MRRIAPILAVVISAGTCFAQDAGGDSASTEALLRKLGEGEARARAAAAGELAQRGVKSAIPAMLPLLDAEDGEARLIAAASLFELGAKELVPRLTELFASRGTAPRLLACDAAIAFGDEESYSTVLDLARRAEPALRRQVIQRLVLSGLEESGPFFEGLLADPDPKTKQTALLALGNLDRKAALPAVEKLLDDSDADTRVAARLAAGMLDPPARAKAVEPLLKSAETRSAACQILARVRSPLAWDILYAGGEPQPGFLDWGNFYAAPEVCETLRRARLPIFEILHAPIAVVLEAFSKKAHVPIRLSVGVAGELAKARWGRNATAIGPRPDAMAALSILNGYFLEGVAEEGRWAWIASPDGVQIVTLEAAAAHWKEFDARRKSSTPPGAAAK